MILPAPMLLDERRMPPFAEPGWIYELKLDGYRLIAGVEDGRMQLATKSGAKATKWFPEVVKGLAMLAGGPHMLDEEVCVLDDLGRSDSNRLQDRTRRRRFVSGCDPVVFCAFDLLARDGKALIGLPVEIRKARLAKLLTPALPSVLYVGHFEAEEGRRIFDHAHELKLKGLMAKKLGSIYRLGNERATGRRSSVRGLCQRRGSGA